jgi:recombination protein RecA
MHVHHRDEDVANDSPDNLVVLNGIEHNRQHAILDHNNLRFEVVEDEIVSIRSVGDRETYDIKMAAPFHNFVAGGFVVHNCGKTTLALSACVSVQNMGGLAFWAETEEAFNSTRAAQLGVDVDSLILLQPESIEEVGQVFETALNAVPSGVGPILGVWDSIAATPTKREIEEGLSGDAKVGDRAMNMNKICRALCPLAVEKRAALLFINQVREAIGVMFGDKYVTPGGKAVKFHSSVRLQMFSGAAVKDSNDKEHVGKTITFLSAKNKLAPPWRKVKARLDYADGWDNLWSTINFAKDRKIMEDSKRYTETNYAEAIKALGWAPKQQEATP